MKLKVSIIIMSHLSDVQTDIFAHKENRHKLNFVKFLVLKHKDTSVEVDADAEYSEFKQKHPEL